MIFYILICFALSFIAFKFFYGKEDSRVKKRELKSLIVIGSGGHTAEMLRVVSQLSSHYQPRLYMMADSDNTSHVKILATEKLLESNPDHFSIVKVPRSRQVGQSYLTSVYTTAYSALRSFQHILRFCPDLVLCNGPGTCVPICLITFALRILLRWRTKIIFIESICRVETLSLTGKIQLYLADFVVVQWPELQHKYPSTVYLGRLF